MNRLRPLPDRLWALVSGVSVRAKILGIILGLVLLLGLGITIQVRSALTNALYRELEEQGVALGRDLAARSADPILINDLFALHRLLQDTLTNNIDARYAFIQDPDGRVLVHIFEGGFPHGLADANSVPSDIHHQLQILSTEEGLIWDVAVPIFEGRAGTARVGLSDRLVQQIVKDITRRLMVTTALVCLVGLMLGGLLIWVLTRPIQKLVYAAEAVGRGDLHHRASVWADDEIGALSRAFNVMTDELMQAEQERIERERLRAQLLESVINAQEDERKRIARELHDETGQALTSLLIGFRVMETTGTLEETRALASNLRKVVAQTMDAIHNLALELRPSVLDDLGLVPALTRYVQSCPTRFDLYVDFVTAGLDGQRLPLEVETTLYRIAQEALTNVARHADVSHASVLLERRRGAVVLMVEDDGRGFDVAQVIASPEKQERLGLYGVEERASLVGGRLTVESRSGAGTTISVEIPLEGIWQAAETTKEPTNNRPSAS